MFKKLWERGLSVIPTEWGEKFWNHENWQRFCEVAADESHIEAWDRKLAAAACGISVTFGPASQNIVGIDIDMLDPEVREWAPLSPVIKCGRPGREFRFYKGVGDLQNGALMFGKAGGIDLFVNGKQTVLPSASPHPGTQKPYFWLTPDTLENFDVKDLPTLTHAEFSAFITRVAKKYPIAAHESAPQESGRNNKLKSMATAARASGKGDTEIAQELVEYDEHNHSPPLFSDPSEGFKGDAFMNALKFVNNVTRSLMNKRDFVISAPDHASAFQPATHHAHKFVPYPEPRGIMKQFAIACNLGAKSNQDALALGGAIAFISALCANRFKTEVRGLPVWPNVYIINLGYSGTGKETAQNLVADLLEPTGLIGAASYRSGTAVIKGLPSQQERLDIIDECSSLLKAMSSDEVYRAEIVEVLSLLYSKASSRFLGYTSAIGGDKQGACFNPCVSLLASTTPSGFRLSIDTAMASKGLLPRFLTFYQPDVGVYAGRKDVSEFNKIKDILKEFVRTLTKIRKLRAGDCPGDAKVGFKYAPTLIPFTKEAHEAWFDWDEHNFNRSKLELDGFQSAFYARFNENAAKLALIDTISQGGTEITLDSFEWGKAVVETQWVNMQAMYEIAAGENRQEVNLLRVLKIIREKGPITKSQVTLKTQWLQRRERDEILKTLSESHRIAERPSGAATGRPGLEYFIPGIDSKQRS